MATAALFLRDVQAEVDDEHKLVTIRWAVTDVLGNVVHRHSTVRGLQAAVDAGWLFVEDGED